MTFSRNTLALVLILSQIFVVSCGKRDDHNLTHPQVGAESEAGSEANYFAPNASFYVDRGGISMYGTKVIVTRDAQQKPNQKDFKVQACLKDKALMGPVQFQDFRIKAGENEVVKQTDIQGCFIWDEQIRYEALANEAELLVVRRIEAIRGHFGAVEIELALNPWASEDSLTITDLRFDSALKARSTSDAVSYTMTQFQSTPDSKARPVFSMEVNKTRVAESIASQRNKNGAAPSDTRMRLDAIQMQFLGHDYDAYEMTSTLNLKVAHKYRIRINPQFIRENFNGKQIFETIASGNVKFHIAILRDTVDTKTGTKYNLDQVLSTAEFTGEMVDGVMVADVTLKFQDLAPLTGRTILVLSSSSLPGYIQFRDGSYISPVGPLVAASTISLVATAWSAETIHANHVKFVSENSARAKNISNFEYFKQVTKFVEMPKAIETSNNTRRSNVVTSHYPEMMKALATDDQRLSLSTKQAICSYLTQERARGVRVCDSKTMELINIRQREIVEDVSNKVPTREGITFNEDLTINMNYMVSNERNRGSAKNYKLGYNAGLNGSLNIGLDLDLLDVIGGQVPGFKLLSWVSKILKNTKPGPPIQDPSNPNGPKIPGPDEPVPPKSGFGAKFGGTLGGVASFNHDLYTWALNDIRRDTGAITTSVKFTANAEMKVFGFQGKFRKCWLANLSSALKEKLAKQAGKEFEKMGLPNGLYACSEKVEEGKRKEMFVLINSVTGIANSPLTDSLASSEAPLRMYFRGPMGYSVFKNMLNKGDMEMNFDKFPADQLISEVKNLKNAGDMYLNQEFPGVLNPVLE